MGRERETERDRDRQTDRQTETVTDREAKRERDRDRDRQTHGQTQTDTLSETNTHTGRQRQRQAHSYRHTNTETETRKEKGEERDGAKVTEEGNGSFPPTISFPLCFLEIFPSHRYILTEVMCHMKTRVIVESSFARDGSTYISFVSVNKSRGMQSRNGIVQDFDEASISMADFKDVGILLMY